MLSKMERIIHATFELERISLLLFVCGAQCGKQIFLGQIRNSRRYFQFSSQRSRHCSGPHPEEFFDRSYEQIWLRGNLLSGNSKRLVHFEINYNMHVRAEYVQSPVYGIQERARGSMLFQKD